jgi:hypothetical protein
MSIADFWKLLINSRLLTAELAELLAADFDKQPSPGEPTVKALAQWLMDIRAITKYQAQVLLTGKPGPFYYGDYKVFERIDKGSLTGSFRAVHNASKYCVILRFASGTLLKDPRQWAAASQNILAATPINSPFVQRHFDAVDLQRFKFFVSEDVRGGTLDETLAGGKLPPAEACRLMRQVAIGLAAMHSAGRVHGDVRPENIVLEAFGNQPPAVKLLFDAAELPQPLDLSQLQAGTRLAAMADYLAPELLAAGRQPDALADIYALGATLYSLLAGHPPFKGGDVEHKLKRQLSEPARPLETLGVPQPLAQLVMYLMAKNPEMRYKSASMVAEQLALFVPPSGLTQSFPPQPPTLALFEQYVRQRDKQPAKTQPQARATPAPSAQPVAAAVPAPLPIPVPVPATAAAPIARPGTEQTVAFNALPTLPELNTKATPAARPARTASDIMRERKRQSTRNLMFGLAGLALLVVVALAGAVVVMNRKPAPDSQAKAGPVSPAAPSGSAPDSNGNAPDQSPGTKTADGEKSPGSAGEGSGAKAAPGGATAALQVVPDDGKALWASPTNGQPVTFRCVPPEGQVFIIVRPAAMLASEEGTRVLSALGPALTAQRAAWEKASGCKLEEIEKLHITLHNNESQFPRASFVVKTVQPLSKLELLARWGDPEVVKEGDETYYNGANWAFYIPKSMEDDRCFAMGAARDIKEVAAVGGEPPVVFREIERLRRATDADRHFTLLFYPQFLFNDDGGPLFAAERAKVRQPLAWLLGDYIQAACVSTHFANEFYFEARMRSSLDKEPYALAEELRDRLNKIPGSLEDYFVSLNAPPYWKKLSNRYPLMIRDLHNQMRIGVENDMAMVNSVLPEVAAHNLVLGGELLVSTTPGQAISVATAAPVASGPKTVAEALQLKTSYSFDQQSLEFAMRDLADDVKSNLKNAPFEFGIKIIGDDLKLDGITRNQSIRDFKQENQTVADILTALVRKANPVTTVKDPSEKDQKLVWLIGPDPDSPAKETVLITTRTAAGTKKYTLPPNFVEKGKK